MNIYEPILYADIKDLPYDLDYYEVRIWIDHILDEQRQFETLKAARKYYKKNNLSLMEDKGLMYVEIIHVKPLKKRVIT